MEVRFRDIWRRESPKRTLFPISCDFISFSCWISFHSAQSTGTGPVLEVPVSRAARKRIKATGGAAFRWKPFYYGGAKSRSVATSCLPPHHHPPPPNRVPARLRLSVRRSAPPPPPPPPSFRLTPAHSLFISPPPPFPPCCCLHLSQLLAASSAAHPLPPSPHLLFL